MRSFMVAIAEEDDFFVAHCPALSVTTQGKTLAEAEANITEAISLYLESFGLEDIPETKSSVLWTTVEV